MGFLKLFCIVMLLGAAFDCLAIKKVTVRGYLKDSVSGESLAGGIIGVAGTSVKTQTNDYGFYSLTVPAGFYKLNYTYVGYTACEKELYLNKDTTVNISLVGMINVMSEVTVNSVSHSENVSRPVTSSPLSINSVKLLPPLLGEADLIRSFQLLPGVGTVGDGASGFNVRGGGIDQNLVLLDEAPLYFTSHLLNLFSVANPDALKDASLYKTEMPARFGGRLSSVLDTRMKDGNNKKWGVSGGLGLIASRITVEGPLRKDKSSMIISARRSYTDIITSQSSNPDIRDNSVYFYDLSAKFNVALSDDDRLFISGYFGKDKIQAEEIFMLQWGNGTGTLRWNHIFNPRLFSNTSFIYSDYNYRLGSASNQTNSFIWHAGISDYTFKSGFNWYPNAANTVFFGLESTLHEFSPGKAEPGGPQSLFSQIDIPGQRGAEYNFYWDHELSLSNSIAVEYGLRYSVFQSIAKGNTTVYDYTGTNGLRKEPVNPKTYTDWQSIRWYHNLQPRVSVKIPAKENASVKLSYSRTAQNLHLVSNTISTSPLDMWTPSSYNIKPEAADQFSGGYFRNFYNDKFETSVELYYRKLYNQTDFVDGAETILNEDQPADMLFGTGRAYGAEVYVRKNAGRLNGWLSYTLSRTERKIDGINNNLYFPARYDKTHSLAMVAVYQLKPRIILSATYIYTSGAPVTLPSERFEYQGFPVQYSSSNSRNNYRIDAYHRADISAIFKRKTIPGKRYSSEWVVSLFNAFNRRNTFSVFLRQNEERPADLEAVRFAMFGTIIPSVTWNFKF